MNTNIDFLYRYICDGREFELSTVQMKELLGGVSLAEPEVAAWMRDYLKEQTQIIHGGVV